MTRIQPINPDQAEGKAQSLLEGARKSMGMVPNLFATMANSPAVLEAYMSFQRALKSGSLSPALREQIALTVAGANSCDYCASAHTAAGSRFGVGDEELAANLQGSSSDAKTQAALAFAAALVESEGWVTDGDLQAIRDAGYSEGAITEIVADVALNIFTNYFNHVAGTEVDFPFVSSNHAQKTTA